MFFPFIFNLLHAFRFRLLFVVTRRQQQQKQGTNKVIKWAWMHFSWFMDVITQIIYEDDNVLHSQHKSAQLFTCKSFVRCVRKILNNFFCLLPGLFVHNCWQRCVLILSCAELKNERNWIIHNKKDQTKYLPIFSLARELIHRVV